jgi:predicted nucleotidyltransferase
MKKKITQVTQKTQRTQQTQMPILPNEKNALDTLKAKLLENYNIVDLKLYGSKAKGTDDRDSDLDVMIVLEDYSWPVETEIDDLIFDINLKFDCFISALLFKRKEIETGALAESPIYKKIQQEGISL